MYWILMLVAILLILMVLRYMTGWLRVFWRLTIWVLLLGGLVTATVYLQRQRSSPDLPHPYQQTRSDDIKYFR